MRGYLLGVRAALTVLTVLAAGTLGLQPGLMSAAAADSGSARLAAAGSGQAGLSQAALRQAGLRRADQQARHAVPDPHSPAFRHPYRHGVVPVAGRVRAMLAWQRTHVHAASANNLNYGGGIDGIGVTTGPESVYLVFYGSQWGSQSTDGNGNVSLTGDPSGEAPYLQQLFKGLGTGGELWSGVMTQYCEGVATGSQTCPSGNQLHVAYPTGGALAGVWVDESTSSPSSATGHQLAVEAISAAAHFGNTTAASNRDAQYVILSPTGTNPDGFNTPGGGFCAWHDYNGDISMSGGPASSPYGDIAFTNLPYVTDAGASCGQDFVNSGSAGKLDGVSIVEGHEYAETITDQNPAGGWTDSGGAETADKCAWIQPGTAGGAGDVVLGTGSFAMQSTWANDANRGTGGCELSHPIVADSGNTVTVTSPGNQSTLVNTAVSLQIHASDSASGQRMTYGATGLPTGLAISSSTGLITGAPGSAGLWHVVVQVTDTTGASGTAAFSWTVSSPGGIVNGGFETGTFSGWTTSGAATSIVAVGAHSGRYAARAGAITATNGDSSIAQTFTAGGATLTFWYNVTCPDRVSYDWATATLKDDTTGRTSTVLGRTCVASSGWRPVSRAVVSTHTYTLTLTSHDDDDPGDATSTLFDDVSVH
ncbi:MAG TPA: putative Ig domain-containing protein [Streptosporangiaceae bacterium]|nr:putative Ig domain-containing protein [Streptosporangiaceae bacterium]